MAALSGLTVSCLATGGPTVVGQLQHLPSKMLWQEVPASGVATTNIAPSLSPEYGPVIFRVFATANAWISIAGSVSGSAPTPSASPRVFVPATTELDYIAQPGDKLAWVLDT